MVAAAGVGVAMGNAMPPVKAVADLEVASNDEDGIAEGLYRLGLLDRPWQGG
jgi:hydroxymethylpyrimidine pyrophosphatase-like HAD family hydrolase